jgi:hypothetical protein
VVTLGAGDVVVIRFPFSDLSARAGKLFTADAGILLRTVGTLRAPDHRLVVEAAVRILSAGITR